MQWIALPKLDRSLLPLLPLLSLPSIVSEAWGDIAVGPGWRCLIGSCGLDCGFRTWSVGIAIAIVISYSFSPL